MQLAMPPRAAPQNAQQKSFQTKNTGMSYTGGTAPPTSLIKITQKSVPLKSSKPEPK